MTVILIGYMGSGKTSIGKKLAKVLDYEFMDLDNYIVSKEDQSISELFSSKGEIYFRKKESQYLRALIDDSKKKRVLALGGGTPCYANNMGFINDSEHVKSVFLKTSIPELVKRLEPETAQRPLIAHLESKDALTEFIGKHIFERNPYYEQSDVTVTTDNKTVDEIVESIILTLY
ncbi:shikimate kinase [Winogradskyella sp. 3972H.M.0a.05]|uniref:shikimate kinase n=1 Tax=Winogradskyella sp. 3972H.M.0a.05 TaxID=2950277 RepID=UPI003397CD20